MKKIAYIIALLPLTVITAKAQQGFGTSTPAPSAVIDMTAGNKGALLPRVSLTGTADIATITSPANWLTVFNTATTSLGTANDVTPGYYYWNGTLWVRIIASTDLITYWGLKGNTGTVDGTNFLGTTDNIPLNFRVNNQLSGRIDPTLNNVFFGYQSGITNTNGSGNTAMGGYALNGNTTGGVNTAIGYLTLATNNAGGWNTAIGSQAMQLNTGGSYNTATGQAALRSNTNGSYNTAQGYSALYANTTGANNTAVGKSVLNTNSTGGGNTAMGVSALSSNTTGNSNTGLGYLALVSTTNGSNETGVGLQAGINDVLGSNNTFLGANTGTPNTGLILTNATAVGYGTVVGASNSLILGNAANVGIGTTTPISRFEVQGSVGNSIRVDSTSTTVTLDANDHTIILLKGVVTLINIPHPSTCAGRVYRFINYWTNDATTFFNIPIKTNDYISAAGITETDYYRLVSNIIGASAGRLAALSIQSDGKNWYTIGM